MVCEIRRLDCRVCGRVRTETVPWARPGARHTRDLEDVVGFLAQRVDKTTVARLLRVSWETVAAIVIPWWPRRWTRTGWIGFTASESTRSLTASIIATSPWSPTTTGQAQ